VHRQCILRVQPRRRKVSHFIYICKALYMFQTGFPSIIRSPKLHIQRQIFVKPVLLPAASLAGNSVKGNIESHLAKTLSRWPMETKIVLTKLLRERRPGVLPLIPKQSDRVLNGLLRQPLDGRN